MPDITRPDGEQILFRSSKTGEHSLDQYLEDAEFGERPLADILQGVFDVTTGNVRQGIVEFRLNATTRELESRAGEFGDPDEGFAGTGAFFSRFQGDFTPGTQYRASDYVRISGTTYLVTQDHLAGPTPDMSKFLDLLASPNLAALGSATGAAANKLLYFTAADTTEFADLTAFGRSLIAAASASATRTLLGLGAVATASLSAFPALTMAGALTLASDPATALQAATKQYVDNGLALKADPLGYTPVNRNGDTMTGFLTLHANPTASLHAATKGYVDTTLTSLVNGKVSKAGDTMTGALTINSDLTVSGALTGNTGAFSSTLSGNLTHRRGGGYLTIGTFNVATYGDGDGRLWWREDLKRLSLQSLTGSDATFRSGYLEAVLQAYAPSGDSTSAPGWSWVGDTNTGFYRADAATIGVSVGGAGTWYFTPSGSIANTLNPPTFGSVGKLSIAGTTSTFTSTITLSRTSDDSTGPVFRLGKSRSTVVGNYAAVQASDELGSIIWYGADGTDGNGIVARIRAIASEAHTTTKSGGYLDFGTTTVGSNVFASRLTIDSASADFSVKLKVTEGSASGVTPSTSADTLVLENGSGNAGVSILTSASDVGYLLFGSPTSAARGQVNYNHGTDTMAFVVASGSKMTLTGSEITATVELTLADASPTGVFSAGFRGMPAVASNANRNLALTDCGKCVYKNNATAYTYTIDPDATTPYPVGSAIMVLNDGTTTNITVARGAGVALVNSAGTNANVAVAPNSNVTLYKVSANRWRALGA